MKPESRGENLPEPILVTNFDRIREKPDINPGIEEFSDIFTGDEYRRKCFDEAKTAFLFVYNKEKLDGYLNAAPSGEGRKYLKNLRKYGLILRTMYNFFDKSYLCSDDFHGFLSSLGEYNDKYWLESSMRGKPEDVAGLNNLEMPVDFTDSQDFKRYSQEILSRINKLLESSVLSIEAFHDLRKKIRLCTNFMQITASENCGGNMHWLFAEMLELSIKLGEKHDEFVDRGLKGEIDYDSSTVEVDKSAVDEFRRLEPFIKKVIGIS